jgi:hypothetical protein
MIKLLMALGISRNEAADCANACGPKMSHSLMGFLVAVDQNRGGPLLSLLTASDVSIANCSTEVVIKPDSPSDYISVRFDYE